MSAHSDGRGRVECAQAAGRDRFLWNAEAVRLIGIDGYGVELGVVGYQFPEAVDLRIQRSWLIITGTAYSSQGVWSFRWQALTPEDAVEVARWLRRAAEERGGSEQRSERLAFTEPNLTFSYSTTDASRIDLDIGLDLEFSPPWRHRGRAGDPTSSHADSRPRPCRPLRGSGAPRSRRIHRDGGQHSIVKTHLPRIALTEPASITPSRGVAVASNATISTLGGRHPAHPLGRVAST